MDKGGGALDAVQGRLLRANLDPLRFDCHSDTSFLRSVILCSQLPITSSYGECTYTASKRVGPAGDERDVFVNVQPRYDAEVAHEQLAGALASTECIT